MVELYRRQRLFEQARENVSHFAEALDIMVLLNAHERFLMVAMTLVNEVAVRYKCDRVSLGWLEGPYVRAQAISNMDRFEKKMAVVQRLEAVMEESFDQDEEIVWPLV